MGTHSLLGEQREFLKTLAHKLSRNQSVSVTSAVGEIAHRVSLVTVD